MKRKIIATIAAILTGGLVAACGNVGNTSLESTSAESTVLESASVSERDQEQESSSVSESGEDTSSVTLVADESAPEIDGLEYEGSLELEYATGFAVHYYSDGFVLIDVANSARYLITPEGSEAPEGLDEETVVLQKPLDNIFMSTTAPMALFNRLDRLENIAFTESEAEDWYIESVATAMENGEIVYAGEFNEPDYEMLVDGDCSLAVEDSMITYYPEVQEMLESLGIPVFIDMSSSEEHPLGRTEWIKAYAAMLGEEEAAQSFFDEQIEKISEAEAYESTDATVAFFYINSDNAAVVRNTTDYMVKMITMAGGTYIYDEPPADASGSNITITMEEFYDVASDADFLIYNTSLGGNIESTDDLVAMNELFADFKAVQDGNVYTTTSLLYQATDSLADFIGDVRRMLTGEGEMSFLVKVS